MNEYFIYATNDLRTVERYWDGSYTKLDLRQWYLPCRELSRFRLRAKRTISQAPMRSSAVH